MRDRLSELLSECLCFGYDDITGTNYVKVSDTADRLIENGVTIPVRCKDCREWCREEIAKRYNAPRYCMLTGVITDEDDFCSCGERRTDV